MTERKKDGDEGKGAVEQDRRDQQQNSSLKGQLGHRDQDPMIKGHDTDYPEPGENEEHTGERNSGGISARAGNLRNEDLGDVDDSATGQKQDPGHPAHITGTTEQEQQTREEHSDAEGARQDQEPGHRQKRNQDGDKDDPLAA
jgi:hypothetical protein